MIIRILKKFNKMLTRHQKVRVFELMILMVIGSFVELLSVSMVLPFINAITNPQKAMKKWYVKIFCDLFHIEDTQTLMGVIALVMAILFLVKNAYLIFEKNIQNRFVYNTMFEVQKKLLHDFIHRPYEYFLDVKSGEIMRMIGNDVKQTFGLLGSLLSLATELFVSVTLIVALILMSPGITIAIAIVLLIAVAIISKFLKPVMRRAGKKNRKAQAQLNRWLLQSIQGIKEIKVSQREKYFEKQYDRHGRTRVKTLRTARILTLIPKNLLEAVMMSTLFFIVAFIIFRGQDLSEIVPIMSVIAMAAVRLLPSANKISSSISDAAFKEPMLDRTIENLDLVDAKRAEKAEAEKNRAISKLPKPFKEEITLNDVTFRYPKGERNVFEHGTIHVKRGTSVGIVGPSGAGKTTAVDIMLGLLHPQEGGVLIDGVNIEDDRKDWLSQLSYIPQQIFMLDDTIRANVAFGYKEDKIDDEKVWRALEDASLAEYVRSLPEGLDTQLRERGVRLSGGQRQRVGIARALYQEPEVLFFDEATSSLDNATEQAIMESINHLHGSKTMIIIAHRLSTIEGCDEIYRVEDGEIRRER